MGIHETIADRRIREAREAGFFDDLPGAGRPIPDLHLERPPGWWAMRVVAEERDRTRREDLERELSVARAGWWRLPAEESVLQAVARWNESIDDHNRRTDDRAADRLPRLDPAAVIARWRDLAHIRRLP
ncbi:MAG: DnaJ family domain-containing protein [Actinomycetota bacterium]